MLPPCGAPVFLGARGAAARSRSVQPCDALRQLVDGGARHALADLGHGLSNHDFFFARGAIETCEAYALAGCAVAPSPFPNSLFVSGCHSPLVV